MNKNGYLDLYGREPYETPTADVVEINAEGIVCTSDGFAGAEGFLWE